MDNKNNYIKIYFLTVLILLALIILGCKFGSTDFTFNELIQFFSDKVGIGNAKNDLGPMNVIIWKLRMPRIILAFTVGGGLAICGVAMQALTQNILAEPYILGIASGASFAVVLANLIFISNRLLLNGSIPIFAFCGAIIATYFVYKIGGTGSNNKLILAGMAISIIFNALTNFLIHFLPSGSAFKNVTMWMWGSLASARWNNIFIPALVTIIVLILFNALGTNFNLISVGNETATTLGVNIEKMRMCVMVMVSILTGVLISVSGLIGFVGFIVPHISRITMGTDHNKLFKTSFVGGGLFLIAADILARTILAPREIAIGVFSALCGGPFFIWLLYKTTKRVES